LSASITSFYFYVFLSKISVRGEKNMKLNEQIKNIRLDHHLSQEQMANQLHVTRQTISNWENDRNLPDSEMLALISKTYNISIDSLVSGKKNKALQKLNLKTTIGIFLLLIGIILFFINTNSVSYIDQAGILHENFFLVPLAYGAIFVALIIFISQAIKKYFH
jgi:transcriptional regulator with XRE-family HTH domain